MRKRIAGIPKRGYFFMWHLTLRHVVMRFVPYQVRLWRLGHLRRPRALPKRKWLIYVMRIRTRTTIWCLIWSCIMETAMLPIGPWVKFNLKLFPKTFRILKMISNGPSSELIRCVRRHTTITITKYFIICINYFRIQKLKIYDCIHNCLLFYPLCIVHVSRNMVRVFCNMVRVFHSMVHVFCNMVRFFHNIFLIHFQTFQIIRQKQYFKKLKWNLALTQWRNKKIKYTFIQKQK